MPRGERVPVYLYTLKHVPGPFPLSSIRLLAFVFLIPWRFTPLWWTRLCCMLALLGTFRVHDKGMQSTEAKGAYHDGRCSTAPLVEETLIFPYEFV